MQAIAYPLSFVAAYMFFFLVNALMPPWSAMELWTALVGKMKYIAVRYKYVYMALGWHNHAKHRTSMVSYVLKLIFQCAKFFVHYCIKFPS